MTTNHQRRTVLITGAAKRIGRVLALDFAKCGWAVGVHYRNSHSDAETLVRTITSFGGVAVALPADLSAAGDVSALLPRCAAALGAPQCLVNNASEFAEDSVIALTPAGWDTHFAVNLKAPVFLARAFYEHLPAGVEGNVVNIVDQRVWKLTPEYFSYTLSKAGLWAATRMLAQALAPRVRVNAVGPGPVLQSVHQTPAEFAAERASTLLRRGTSPDEIAAAIQFILDAPAMTGQMIALDGGQHLTHIGERNSPGETPSRPCPPEHV